jgi:3-keto-disaccharide hydrolase
MRRVTVLATLALLLVSPLAAEEEAARYFVDRGTKALDEQKFHESERFFNKALVEESGFPAALFGLARVAHARGDKNLAAGRLEACIEACGRGATTADRDKVRKAAESLLAKVDRPRLDFMRAVQAYTRALMSLARRSIESSPDLARRCVERILKVCPNHAEAQALQPKLGAGAAAELPDNAVALFNGKDLTGWAADPPTWTVKDGLLVGHGPDHAYYGRTKATESGDYTLIFEFRITKDWGEDPLISLIFGMRGVYERWHLSVFDTKFRLCHYPNGNADAMEKLDEIFGYQLPGGFDRTKWSTVRIVVKGDIATFYANGNKLFERRSRAKAFDGFVGLVIQECTAEFRKIAVIR